MVPWSLVILMPVVFDKKSTLVPYDWAKANIFLADSAGYYLPVVIANSIITLFSSVL